MNICHLSSPLSWRGGEQQIAYLLHHLEENKAEHITISPGNSSLTEYCKSLKYSCYNPGEMRAFNLLTAKQIQLFCKNLKPDILHIHDSHAHTLAVLSACLFGNKTPFVLSRRVDFPLKKNKFSEFKYNYPAIKRIICVSKAIADIISHNIKDQHKISVVYDGINLNRFQKQVKTNKLKSEFDIPGEYILIGNVAALAPHKDPFTFVDTAKMILDSGFKCKFIWIGAGELKEKVLKYVEMLELSEHIILTGFRNDLDEIFCNLDVLLYTSETEGLGSTILDAYAVGIPVVSTNAGGIPEIVIHEKTGLLAPVKNKKELKFQLERLLTDFDLRNRLITKATQFVEQFSDKEMANQTYQIYNDILAS